MRTILVRGSKDCPGGVGSFPTFALDTPNYFWYNQDRRIMTKSRETKVAEKIAGLVDSVDLDLDRVGIELARIQPKTFYNRALLVMESAVEEQERQSGKQFDTLF
jgi:hypothetical protein